MAQLIPGFAILLRDVHSNDHPPVRIPAQSIVAILARSGDLCTIRYEGVTAVVPSICLFGA